MEGNGIELDNVARDLSQATGLFEVSECDFLLRLQSTTLFNLDTYIQRDDWLGKR